MDRAIMPDRIARLDRDARGYPIPWNVLRGEDGMPFFTINDDRKTWRALAHDLCPLCGEALGRWKWFTGGPRSAFHEHGWYLDLPAHHDCARFALATCPWLANPRYSGLLAEGAVPHAEKLTGAPILIDNTVDPKRPEVFVAAASDRIQVQRNGVDLPYVRPKRPYLAVEYWRHGRQISEAEAFPHLRTALGAEWMPPALREDV